MENLVEQASGLVEGGYSGLARACGVAPRTVKRWKHANKLPESCLNGFRPYHTKLAQATGHRITSRQFIEWTREGWKRHYEQSDKD